MNTERREAAAAAGRKLYKIRNIILEMFMTSEKEIRNTQGLLLVYTNCVHNTRQMENKLGPWHD